MPSWGTELKISIKKNTRATNHKKASQYIRKNTNQSMSPQKYKVQIKSTTIKTLKGVPKCNKIGQKKSTNQSSHAIYKKPSAKLKKNGY